MDKRKKLITILAGTMALLIVALLMLLLLDTEPEPEIVETEIISFGSELLSIEAQNNYGGFFMSKDPEPKLQGVDESLYDDEKIAAYFAIMSQITSNMKIADDDLSKYGLDAPSARLLYIDDKGNEKSIYLGIRNEMYGTYYVKVTGDGNVYMVDEAVANAMNMMRSEFRHMDLYPPLENGSYYALKNILIKNNIDGTETEFVQTPEATELLPKYRMIKPASSELNWDQMEAVVLSKIAALKGEMLLSEDAPPSSVGLDDPDYVLELAFEKETVKILFKKDEGSNLVYVKSDGNPAIFVISAAKMEFLEKDHEEYIGNSVYSINVNKVSSLTIELPSESYVFKLSGNPGKVTAEVKGKTLETNDFITIYSKCTSITLMGSAQSGAPKEKLLLKLTFELKDGLGTDIVELYEKDARTCTVFVNGSPDFETLKSVIAEMEFLLDAYVEGS